MSADAVLSARERLQLEALAAEWCGDYHQEPPGTPYRAPRAMLQLLERRLGAPLRPAQIEFFREAWSTWVRAHGNGGAVGRSSASGPKMGANVRRFLDGK